jgi:hypothetical protein
MKQVQYVLVFKGSAAPKPGADGYMVASSAAMAGSITTTIGDGGVDAAFKAGGGQASFASEVRLNKDGTFVEDGTITFGKAGSISFSTREVGFMAPSADPDITHGAIMWQINKGTGVFDGASGIITSNFRFSKSGDVVDNQWGVIFLK